MGFGLHGASSRSPLATGRHSITPDPAERHIDKSVIPPVVGTAESTDNAERPKPSVRQRRLSVPHPCPR